jgi:eukaryotic-like serine/threonine-protein kinase
VNRERWKKISLILDEALAHPRETRNTYIYNVCGNEHDLAKEVQQLLTAMEDNRDDDESMDILISGNNALIESGASEETEPDIFQQGETIGRWMLKELLGRGGMGSVYRAERTNDSGIHQAGALKIIHKNLVIPSHIERFKIEQQILARLHHPTIAGFIDSGITADGIPYMVMEYVEGDTVIEYCNRHRLSIDQRLDLFRNICRAVQYAHKQLVVHRDLKPDHILVTGDGHVKILDFGIAKLLEPDKFELSALVTQSGQRLLSLEYASPEQISGEPATTACDQYSLGILLYKLLTGFHPFDVENLSFRQLEKTILEKDPPLPGRRLSECNSEELSGISQQRNSNPVTLINRLKGDLDAITCKVLRKDPEDRYASVDNFVLDLERHKNGLPVSALPDSRAYRVRKFIYRNRGIVIAAAIILLTLVGGVMATLWQARQAHINAEQARIQAQRAEEVTGFMTDLFEAGDPAVAQGSDITIAEILNRGMEKALEPNQNEILQLDVISVLGRIFQNLGDYEKSVVLLKAALEITGQLEPYDALSAAEIQARLGVNYRLMGNLAKADSLNRKALETHEKLLGKYDPITIGSLEAVAAIHAYLTRNLTSADSLYREVVIRHRKVPGEKEALAVALSNLGYIKILKAEYTEALHLYIESSEIYRTTRGEHHPDLLRTQSSLAYVHHKLGNHELAEQLRIESIEARTRVLGENHPQLGLSYHYLADLLYDIGRFEEALINSRKAVEIIENAGATHPAYPDLLVLLAKLYHKTANLSLAGETYHKASNVCIEARGSQSPACSRLNFTAAEFFIEQLQYKTASEFLQPSYKELQKIYEPGHAQRIKLEEMLALISEK